MKQGSVILAASPSDSERVIITTCRMISMRPSTDGQTSPKLPSCPLLQKACLAEGTSRLEEAALVGDGGCWVEAFLPALLDLLRTTRSAGLEKPNWSRVLCFTSLPGIVQHLRLGSRAPKSHENPSPVSLCGMQGSSVSCPALL